MADKYRWHDFKVSDFIEKYGYDEETIITDAITRVFAKEINGKISNAGVLEGFVKNSGVWYAKVYINNSFTYYDDLLSDELYDTTNLPRMSNNHLCPYKIRIKYKDEDILIVPEHYDETNPEHAATGFPGTSGYTSFLYFSELNYAGGLKTEGYVIKKGEADEDYFLKRVWFNDAATEQSINASYDEPTVITAENLYPISGKFELYGIPGYGTQSEEEPYLLNGVISGLTKSIDGDDITEYGFVNNQDVDQNEREAGYPFWNLSLYPLIIDDTRSFYTKHSVSLYTSSTTQNSKGTYKGLKVQIEGTASDESDAEYMYIPYDPDHDKLLRFSQTFILDQKLSTSEKDKIDTYNTVGPGFLLDSTEMAGKEDGNSVKEDIEAYVTDGYSGMGIKYLQYYNSQMGGKTDNSDTDNVKFYLAMPLVISGSGNDLEIQEYSVEHNTLTRKDYSGAYAQPFWTQMGDSTLTANDLDHPFTLARDYNKAIEIPSTLKVLREDGTILATLKSSQIIIVLLFLRNHYSNNTEGASRSFNSTQKAFGYGNFSQITFDLKDNKFPEGDSMEEYFTYGYGAEHVNSFNGEIELDMSGLMVDYENNSGDEDDTIQKSDINTGYNAQYKAGDGQKRGFLSHGSQSSFAVDFTPKIKNGLHFTFFPRDERITIDNTDAWESSTILCYPEGEYADALSFVENLFVEHDHKTSDYNYPITYYNAIRDTILEVIETYPTTYIHEGERFAKRVYDDGTQSYKLKSFMPFGIGKSDDDGNKSGIDLDIEITDDDMFNMMRYKDIIESEFKKAFNLKINFTIGKAFNQQPMRFARTGNADHVVDYTIPLWWHLTSEDTTNTDYLWILYTTNMAPSDIKYTQPE